MHDVHLHVSSCVYHHVHTEQSTPSADFFSFFCSQFTQNKTQTCCQCLITWPTTCSEIHIETGKVDRICGIFWGLVLEIVNCTLLEILTFDFFRFHLFTPKISISDKIGTWNKCTTGEAYLARLAKCSSNKIMNKLVNITRILAKSTTKISPTLHSCSHLCIRHLRLSFPAQKDTLAGDSKTALFHDTISR